MGWIGVVLFFVYFYFGGLEERGQVHFRSLFFFSYPILFPYFCFPCLYILYVLGMKGMIYWPLHGCRSNWHTGGILLGV